MSDLPKIALTMGDPAGIGPEICLRLIADNAVANDCVPLIFGHAETLRMVAEQLNISAPAIVFDLEQSQDWQAVNEPCIVNVGELAAAGNGGKAAVQPGEVSAVAGKAAFDFVVAAIDAAIAGQVDAICTAPINKEALHAAGINYPGHTEILADRTETQDYCMLMTSEAISTCLVTTHIGLGAVTKVLMTEKISSAIRLSADALRRIRGREPRIVVCGLNPHAGENGLFGDEEERIIQPAIDAARADGLNIVGPLPPDTSFLPSQRSKTDVYICMYHDQGLIPLKALAFDTAVNVTLGLPIVRTSVDHGTAFDIAWQGVAEITSLISAMKLAAKLSS